MAIENHQLVDIIRRRMGNETIAAFADSLSLNAPTLSEILNGIRPVTAPVADAMGYKRVKTVHITYAKKAAK